MIMMSSKAENVVMVIVWSKEVFSNRITELQIICLSSKQVLSMNEKVVTWVLSRESDAAFLRAKVSCEVGMPESSIVGCRRMMLGRRRCKDNKTESERMAAMTSLIPTSQQPPPPSLHLEPWPRQSPRQHPHPLHSNPNSPPPPLPPRLPPLHRPPSSYEYPLLRPLS